MWCGSRMLTALTLLGVPPISPRCRAVALVGTLAALADAGGLAAVDPWPDRQFLGRRRLGRPDCRYRCPGRSLNRASRSAGQSAASAACVTGGAVDRRRGRWPASGVPRARAPVSSSVDPPACPRAGSGSCHPGLPLPCGPCGVQASWATSVHGCSWSCSALGGTELFATTATASPWLPSAHSGRRSGRGHRRRGRPARTAPRASPSCGLLRGQPPTPPPTASTPFVHRRAASR